MNTYKLSIITPEGAVFDEPAESLVVPGTEGSLGILSGHTPIASTLKEGIVEVRKAGRTRYFVIDKGILEMSPQNECTVLCNTAKETENLQEAKRDLRKLMDNFLF